MLGNGPNLALAYVVGFETECRIGGGVHLHHYDKGWHPTATPGIFGTVAAAARLLRPTPEQTAVALGMAASFASRLDDYPSRGPAGVPMTRDELWTKFSDCVLLALPSAQVLSLFDMLMAIETLGSTAELPRLLEAPLSRSQAA